MADEYVMNNTYIVCEDHSDLGAETRWLLLLAVVAMLLLKLSLKWCC